MHHTHGRKKGSDDQAWVSASGSFPTLLSAFFYFDMSFMVWVMLGPLGAQIGNALHLDAGQKGLMVAVPLLVGALLRVVNGILVDQLGPKRAGMIGQVIVIAGLLIAWLHGINSFGEVLLLGVVLGVAGASFAVALPLASRWYPPEYQGIALGIAGAGNSGTVFAALFFPIARRRAGLDQRDRPGGDSADRRVHRLRRFRQGRAERTAPGSRSRNTSTCCASATPGGSCCSIRSPSAASPA